MNLQQLEYIVAIDTHRHFVTAAEACHIAQATLSMMVKKLEEELGTKIFDRSRQPVVPTDIGQKLIAQARIVLQESQRMRQIVSEAEGQLSGELRIGIIPTVAPYLLHRFLHSFRTKYQAVRLHVAETNTEAIVKGLEQQHLDVGILALPLASPGIVERMLFADEFVLYAAPGDILMQKKYVLPADIDPERLWLLEEGHCLRAQVLNFCTLKIKDKPSRQGIDDSLLHQPLDFAAGSIETLKNIVDANGGITILPSMALATLSTSQRAQVRHFASHAPHRTIGLATYRYLVKAKLVDALAQEILTAIAPT